MATPPQYRAVTIPLMLLAQQQRHAVFRFGAVVIDGANILPRYLTMGLGIRECKDSHFFHERYSFQANGGSQGGNVVILLLPKM